MAWIHRNVDIRGQMILLGTGTSVGVPTIGCGCDVCIGGHIRNQRTRTSCIFGLSGGNLLIDTGPDLRTQLLREGIGLVHAVAYTHEHSDHVMGMDDLRLFPFFIGRSVPLLCEERVERRIRAAFDYAFTDEEPTHAGAIPKVEFRRIGLDPFEVLGERIIPIRLKHGPKFDVLGFRVGKIAYCTDTNEIPPASQERLQGLDVLVLDALRPRPHVTHFSLQEAIEMAQRLAAKRTIFTHISHELDYETVNAQLPAGMELGYDGMRIPLPEMP